VFVNIEKLWLFAVVIIPEAPSWVNVNAVNTTVLEVTWSASNDTDYYHITCNSLAMNVLANETTYLIVRLEPGANYTVSVAACASLCSNYTSSSNNTGLLV